jgi:DNA-binding XRE family transcriptional regulator
MNLNYQALKAIRERSGISQTTVALEVGIDRGNYAHIEAGRRTATDKQIISIAKSLVVPVSAIAYRDAETVA